MKHSVFNGLAAHMAIIVTVTCLSMRAADAVSEQFEYAHHLLDSWSKQANTLAEEADINADQQAQLRAELAKKHWYQSKSDLRRRLEAVQREGISIYQKGVQAKNMVQELMQLLRKAPQGDTGGNIGELQQQIEKLQAQQVVLQVQLNQKEEESSALQAELDRYKEAAAQELGEGIAENLAVCATLQGELNSCITKRAKLERELLQRNQEIAQLQLSYASQAAGQVPLAAAIPAAPDFGVAASSSSMAGIPQAPPLSGLPRPAAYLPTGDRAALMESIRQAAGGASLLNPSGSDSSASQTAGAGGDARSALLDAIRGGGVKLRPAAGRRLSARKQGKGGLMDELEKAMVKRRIGIKGAPASDAEVENDWD